MSRVDIETTTTIDAPIDTVAGFAADPSNAPEWYTNIRAVEWLTPREVRVGARIAFVATFVGRTLRYVYEIVQWVPHERLVMQTTQGPFPMETTYTWAPWRGSTTMTLRSTRS